MNSFLSSLAFGARRASLFSLTVQLAPAAAAQSAGAVSGVVTDPQGAFVQGAEVKIDNSALATTTDRSGHFRLDGVPAGAQRVTASYLGLPDVSAPGTARAGRLLCPPGPGFGITLDPKWLAAAQLV